MARRFFISAVLILIFFKFTVVRAKDQWDSMETAHFIVYYKDSPEEFVEEVLEKSEEIYASSIEDFGSASLNFWISDARAKIYIHNNSTDYQNVTGQPEWSAGAAIPQQKAIHTFLYARDFLERILPHEMRHLIFRELVGFDNYSLPVWLDEGVASYEGDTRFSNSNMIVKEAIKNQTFIPLEGLSSMNPNSLRNPKTAELFYAEAESIVSYLIGEFGNGDFSEFCGKLKQERDFDTALSSVYSYSNIKELEEAWLNYLG